MFFHLTATDLTAHFPDFMWRSMKNPDTEQF